MREREKAREGVSHHTNTRLNTHTHTHTHQVNKDDPKAQDKFAEINNAYEILSDDEKRRMYDMGACLHPDFRI